MKILAVDDEQLLLDNLKNQIEDSCYGAEVHCFSNADSAYALVKKEIIDVAFLDIQLGNASGIELAKKIKQLQPKCNIVFCTGYSEYATDAFEISASDYLLKPITAKKVKHALENLRNPLAFQIPVDKLFFRCFGEFEVFLNGAPVDIFTKRSKELLAYLIDRQGALCSTADILENVFQNMSDVNLRIARKDLIDSLEKIGYGDILIRSWGKLGIDRNKIICDAYEYISGNPAVVNLYRGKYMTGYSWARFENKK